MGFDSVLAPAPATLAPPAGHVLEATTTAARNAAGHSSVRHIVPRMRLVAVAAEAAGLGTYNFAIDLAAIAAPEDVQTAPLPVDAQRALHQGIELSLRQKAAAVRLADKQRVLL